MPDGFKIAEAFVEVNPDLGGFRERLQAGLDEATAGQGGQVDVRFAADDSRLLTALEDIRVQLEQVEGTTHDVRLTLEDAGFAERLDNITLKLSEVGAKDVSARVSVDTGDSEEKLAAVDAELRSKPGDAAAAGGALGNLSGMFYLVAGAVLAAGQAIPTLSTALTGLGGVAGTAFLAFKGVSQALSDYTALQQQSGQVTAQAASTAFSNAVAIANAQRAVSDAERQAGQDALTSAASIISAQQAVAASEHTYTEALFSEQQAQVALTQARLQARLQLQSLNNAEIDGKLSVQAAVLGLQQAQLNQTQTDANALSTQLQREQAALAVAEAERQLIEARQNETNAAAAANRANAQGVAGNPQVVAAQHALADASYQVRQARQGEANAERALQAAREQAAFQAAKDAEAVSVAQQNLTNTERQQQLQAAASGSAMSKFAQDMASLTGPQRQLVREFESFTGVLTRMEAIAGKAVLPGVTVFLRGLHSVLPEAEAAIRKFGGVASGILTTIGQALSSPRFKADFAAITDAAVTFMRDLAPLSGMFGALFDAMAKSGPAVAGLAGALDAIGAGLGAMFKAGEPGLASFGSVLSSLGQAVGDLGQPLGELGAVLAQVLAPVLHALLPGWKVFLDALGSGLATALRDSGPGLAALAQDLSLILTDLGPLLPLFGRLIGEQLQALTPILVSLQPLLAELGPLFADIAKWMGPVVTVMSGIDGVIGDTIGWVIGLLTKTRTWVDVWHALDGFLHGVVDGWTSMFHSQTADIENTLSRAWDSITGRIRSVWTTIGGWLHGTWNTISRDAQTIFSGAVNALGTIWGRLEGVFRTPVNFLINTVYMGGIRRLWDDVVNAVGLKSLDLPSVTPLASGGIVPGRDRGRDEHLAALRPEEAVLVPGAARFLGHSTIHALNAMFGGGGPAQPGHYAQGGIVPGFITSGLHDIGSFFGGLFDVGKMAAALVTGNATALSNAFADVISKAGAGLPAQGDLFRVMTAVPRTLMDDAIHAAIKAASSLGAPGGGGSGHGFGVPGHPSGSVLSWFEAAMRIAGAPASWLGDLETIGYYESGWNPDAINLSDSNAAAGDPSRGVMQTIMSTFDAYHRAGTSWNIFDPVANIAAAIGYIRSRYGSVFGVPGIVSLSHGGGYVGYDSGGYLPPGFPAGMPVNTTGRPEAVLTPAESAAFVAIVKQLTAEGGAGGGGLGPVVNFNYFGPQAPTAEQQAIMRRDLALALGPGP